MHGGVCYFRSCYSIAISILEGRMNHKPDTPSTEDVVAKVGDWFRKSRVPFASYDILIHVFGNHDKMNRELLEWHVPVTTSVNQERTFDF